jgi:hypothetical protein
MLTDHRSCAVICNVHGKVNNTFRELPHTLRSVQEQTSPKVWNPPFDDPEIWSNSGFSSQLGKTIKKPADGRAF